MTFLVDILSRRVEFMSQDQEPNSDGGYTQKYKKLAGAVWAGCKPLSASTASYIRSVQTGDAPTHLFTVRRSVPMGVATGEEGGVVKSDNFIFLLTSNSGTTGRLFRILTSQNVGEMDEYIEIMSKEMGQFDTSRGQLV